MLKEDISKIIILYFFLSNNIIFAKTNEEFKITLYNNGYVDEKLESKNSQLLLNYYRVSEILVIKWESINRIPFFTVQALLHTRSYK